MPPLLALLPVLLAAGFNVTRAHKRQTGTAPPDPWDAWRARAEADLERRRRYCLARMGRRWLLHPDNQVRRK
jgi:hypothetical protein